MMGFPSERKQFFLGKSSTVDSSRLIDLIWMRDDDDEYQLPVPQQLSF